MVPQIEERETGLVKAGQEQLRAHARPAQGAVNSGPGVSDADAVDQDPHFDTAGPSCGQRQHERMSRAIVAEDEAGQRDRVFRLVDGLEHGGVCLVAVLEDVDVVAREEWSTGDLLPETRQRKEVLGDRRWSARPCDPA